MEITSELLKQVTQVRLCAAFINQDSLQAIRGLPIYAEAVATITPLTPPIQTDEGDFKYLYGQLDSAKFTPQQIDLVRILVINYLAKQYGQPSHQDMAEIIASLAGVLSKLKNEVVNDFTDKRIEAIIEEVVNGLIKDQRIQEAHLPEEAKPIVQYLPFGYLATDQVGYISFDIEKAIKPFTKLDSEVELEYWMYPYGDLDTGINISALGRVTENYVYGVIKLVNPVKQLSSVSYHAIQNPGMIDWYLSPSSFSVNPKYFIGDDGCEQLFPANFATSEFRFFQLLREEEIGAETYHAGDLPIRKGFAFEYNTTWQPLGHTLGQILYSLPLAPGEVVKIGIIDWKRKSEDGRQEDTTVSEDLTHETYRDRSISETVEASLKEWQRGGSVMGGNAGAAGVSYGVPMFGAAAGAAHSFGGGYSTSSGDRDFTASTVQQVNDAFSQHSTALRELRSTIVVQSDQQEYARAETRVIANNNHSHALTMLYYEVLRHYKVTTQFVRRRNVLLVDYSRWKVDFTNVNEINRYRKILEQGLLEPRYLTYFDVVHSYLAAVTETNYQNGKTPEVDGEEDIIFTQYLLGFSIGNDGMGNDNDDNLQNDSDDYSGDYFLVELKTSDGICKLMERGGPYLRRNFKQGSYKEITATGSIAGLRWDKIQELTLSVKMNGNEDVRLLKFTLQGIDGSGLKKVLFDEVLDVALEDDADAFITLNEPINPGVHVKGLTRATRAPIQSSAPEPSAFDVIQPQERMNLQLLKNHLIDNVGYYQRLIWLNQDVNDRAQWMGEVDFNGGKLIDFIENRPIDVLGNHVAFPSNFEEVEASQLRDMIYKGKTEKLLTLPTRGVFGEAKLGHCNASEVIDNTRFWDWQQSPILEKAPDIDPVSTESRNVTQNLSPTPFPSSIVNIVNPSAAPDPTAMAGALSLLGKSDIFRDMSMSKEVNDLLKKLSDNSVSMAEAATQARGILQNQDGATGSSGNGSSSPSSGTGNSTASTGPSTPTLATTEETESKEIDNAQKKLELAKSDLTPKQQQKVREKVTADLTKKDRYIHIELQTADNGGIIDVIEPADYDINQQYQGKLAFVGGTATVKTKNQNGSFHIKLKGKVPNIPGREYFSQIPGYENQTGEYYFESNCHFKFPVTTGDAAEEDSIALHGSLTLKTSEAVVNVDAEGKLSLEGGLGISLPVRVVKLDLLSKAQVDLAGKIGYRITYKIESITGLSLKQQ